MRTRPFLPSVCQSPSGVSTDSSPLSSDAFATSGGPAFGWGCAAAWVFATGAGADCGFCISNPTEGAGFGVDAVDSCLAEGCAMGVRAICSGAAAANVGADAATGLRVASIGTCAVTGGNGGDCTGACWAWIGGEAGRVCTGAGAGAGEAWGRAGGGAGAGWGGGAGAATGAG